MFTQGTLPWKLATPKRYLHKINNTLGEIPVQLDCQERIVNFTDGLQLSLFHFPLFSFFVFNLLLFYPLCLPVLVASPASSFFVPRLWTQRPKLPWEFCLPYSPLFDIHLLGDWRRKKGRTHIVLGGECRPPLKKKKKTIIQSTYHMANQNQSCK